MAAKVAEAGTIIAIDRHQSRLDLATKYGATHTLSGELAELTAGIIEATLARMSAPPEDLLAWFGPAISQPAFEVGDEVRAAFVEHSPAADAAFVANDRGRWQADLYSLAAQRLAAAGVHSVSGGGLCTFADAERFYSYRRDGETGRMLSFIFRRD